jgi:hypothetical protein
MAEEEVKQEETTEAAPSEEAAPAAAPAAAEEASVEVPAKFKKFVEEIEAMTVLELNELVKVFEKKFGVSALQSQSQVLPLQAPLTRASPPSTSSLLTAVPQRFRSLR